MHALIFLGIALAIALLWVFIWSRRRRLRGKKRSDSYIADELAQSDLEVILKFGLKEKIVAGIQTAISARAIYLSTHPEIKNDGRISLLSRLLDSLQQPQEH